MREERDVDVGNVRLHVLLDGPPAGRPLLLLHGFPECAHAWHRQLGAFAGAGFRVVVPDLRGYGLSDKPARVADYDIALLADDVLELADALGLGPFDLAGHDWGAAIGWHLAQEHRERIRRFVAIDGPHLDVFHRAFLRSPLQHLRSWYIHFFQLPWLPEWAMLHGLADSYFLQARKPTGFTPQDRRILAEARARPGAVRAMIHYYRAAYRRFFRQLAAGVLRGENPWAMFEPPDIEVPTLVLWGEHDRFVPPSMAEDCRAMCVDGRLHVVARASHWLMVDQHEELAQTMIDFFLRSPPLRAAAESWGTLPA
jgi:pimeloyl-ACP methyl ester carboxylesterase